MHIRVCMDKTGVGLCFSNRRLPPTDGCDQHLRSEVRIRAVQGPRGVGTGPCRFAFVGTVWPWTSYTLRL